MGIALFKNVGLVSRLDNKSALDLAFEIYEHLNLENLEVFPELEFAKKFDLKNPCALSEFNVDLIITVGGDGTVLKTCMLIPKPETPILSINMGRRGYLTEVESSGAIDAIRKCLNGDFRIEKHDKLTIKLENKEIVDGLNEVLINSIMPWKMLDFEVSLNKDFLLYSRADALIIATTTGSTAHSLSAGGPIIHSTLDAFVLVFICPSEPVPSIVLPNDGELEIRIKNPKLNALITIDGRHQQKIGPDQTLVISKSEHMAAFVRFGESYTNKSLFRTLNDSRKAAIRRFK